MSKIETPASSAHGQSVGGEVTVLTSLLIHHFELTKDSIVLVLMLWFMGLSWVCFSVVPGEVLCQDLHSSDPTSTSCSRM